jgi:hypothetical protein
MSKPFPPHIDVEESFNEFVVDFGGEVISDLLSKSPSFKNADYFFQTRSIVAELKCLEKDTFQDRTYRRKMGILYDKWVRQGFIPDSLFRPTKIETKDYPLECQRDVHNLLKRPIETRIKEANRQIKQTKEYFNLPHAKGLLLLVNDGNYSFESDALLYTVGRSLKNQFTSINSLVYFTVNMPATKPDIDRDVLVWVDARARETEEELPREFLDELCNGWISFLKRKTGEDIPRGEFPDEAIDEIKFIQRRRI